MLRHENGLYMLHIIVYSHSDLNILLYYECLRE